MNHATGGGGIGNLVMVKWQWLWYNGGKIIGRILPWTNIGQLSGLECIFQATRMRLILASLDSVTSAAEGIQKEA